MELDELKRSWNEIDRHLQEKKLVDEKQIARLIENYKTTARRSIGHLVGWHRFSLWVSIIAATVCIACGVWLIPAYWQIEEEQTRHKLLAICLFIAFTLLIGGWWDWMMYKKIRQIHIDEMRVAEVSRRIASFGQWIRYEVIALCVWAIAFSVLYYWIMNYRHAPLEAQVCAITCFVLVDGLVIYFVYRKIVYKHLNNIKRNINELKEICTE